MSACTELMAAHGAVSVTAENGKELGVRPAEFEVVAWRENKA